MDGNHENFDLLNALPEKEWHGGRVHEVRENILHLMRGQIFTFGGLTWFTMGGASSHDIQDGVLDPEAPDFEQKYWLLRRMRGMFRVKGRSWWAEEMPNAREYVEALKNLEQVNWNCHPAFYLLGKMYCNGLGVPMDIAKGVEYLQKASEVPEAKEELRHYKKTFFGKWVRR